MLLEVQNINKKFKEGYEVLKDVNLHIEAGEIVGLIGMNGAGKSTIMRIISGVSTYQGGGVFFEGSQIKKLSSIQRKKIAFLCASNNLYEEMTVADNLEVFKKFYNASDMDKQSMIDELDLGKILKRKVSELSSGMQQRVAIACAMVGKPKLVMMDEPTVSLDIENKCKIIRFIQSHLSPETGILITSHNSKDIEELCERIYILRHGEIVKESTVKGVLREASRHNKRWIVSVQLDKEKRLDNLLQGYNFNYTEDSVDIYVEESNKKSLLQMLNDFEIISVKSEVDNLEDAILEVAQIGGE
ncbi:ABC transporter ATP-binding protein [[Clostridium] fimetarium]|uniref:ABC-2 type transport system ATP-binding protein n=1 Tax=[Clostridium] fimetarium TaxID=99656 RepID=A0A1I0NNI5_9FIRM|nr:ABC transporter ATP-binding protein [[Clostridium] fimetarium]SEW02430.1 ABC-2 type transport system ATP-binding protein [[Clostridium] fimetarium]